jgi:putative SOS response-associated peptidase YedK
MCYDIKASLESQLKRARLRNDLQAIREITERLAPLTDLPIFHASGFSHPELLIYTDRSPDFPEVATWGLVPDWVHDNEQRKKQWNNTLNARGETIFEKASFRDAAKNQRCLIYIDGFYEHHHFKNNTYPFFIQRTDGNPMALAGLWNEWHDPDTGGKLNTFSIVTTVGNTLMGRIHNNPKLEEPRMPVILPEALEDEWLKPYTAEFDKTKLQELLKAYPEDELKAFTVGKLRGKDYAGNVEKIAQEVIYDDLEF